MTDAHSKVDSQAIDALVSIIMNRRGRVLEALSVMGSDFELEVAGVEVTLVEGGAYRIATGHTQSVPALARRSIRDRLFFAVNFEFPDDTELAATEMILSGLGDSYHQLWTTISPEDKEDVAPAIVVFQDIFWPLADYFISLAPSDDEAGDLAQRLAKDVLASLVSGTGKVVERAALGGIRVQEPVAVGRLLVRPLTPPELREVAGRWNYGDLDLAEPGLVQPERELGLRGTAVLESRTDWDATSSPPDPYLAERVVLAMQLLDIDVSGAGWVSTSTEPPPSRFHSGRRVPIPLHPRERKATDMNEALLSEVSDLASKLPIEAVTQPVTRQHVALNRFFRGRATEAAESLLEYTIGLEAVLLPRKFEGELAFRLRVNAAWMLAENRIERHEVAKRLRKVYEIRSALVHGLDAPKAEEVRGAAAWAEDVLRRLLVRCISLGWPDDHELALLALG